MILHGDCRAVMAEIDAASVDAIVTDPPYGLAFMGKGWDHGIPGPAFWTAALRVAKPGAYLLAFGGTRTFHRLTCAIEDAGWEVKDCLMWLHGQGFPKHKSLLKPGYEPIVLAKKPGPGVLNIDACRIEASDNVTFDRAAGDRSREQYRTGTVVGRQQPTALGRWPANVVLDEEAAAALDAMSGERTSGTMKGTYKGGGTKGIYGDFGYAAKNYDSNTGGASRFFYCAKASRTERGNGNIHPCVKPIALMRWLVRLVTPPDGLVLDPFAGSGTTGVACALEGFRFVGVEQSEEYVEIARRRIAHWTPQPDELARVNDLALFAAMEVAS